MREIDIVREGENYTIGDIGKYNELNEYSYIHPMLKLPIQGKVFAGEKINMTSVEISFQILEAGKEILFDHLHNENEEVYIVLKGSGKFIIDNEETSIKEGSIVRIAPKGKRRWRSNLEEDLTMMVIQGVNGSLNKFNVTDGYTE